MIKYDTGSLFLEGPFLGGGEPSVWISIIDEKISHHVENFCKENNVLHPDTRHTSTFNMNGDMARGKIMCAELAYAAFENLIRFVDDGIEFQIGENEDDTASLTISKSLSGSAMDNFSRSAFEFTFHLESHSDECLSKASETLYEYLDSVHYYEMVGSRYPLVNLFREIKSFFTPTKKHDAS